MLQRGKVRDLLEQSVIRIVCCKCKMTLGFKTADGGFAVEQLAVFDQVKLPESHTYCDDCAFDLSREIEDFKEATA